MTQHARLPREIGIVGAGPAGIMAALEAASVGARVHLFDTNALVGRKLLVTGNGRCNLSNAHVAPERYACTDRRFLATAFDLCGHADTIWRLRDLGILTYATDDGWCYPVSNAAATVQAALAAALEVAGVQVHLQTKVVDIRIEGGRPVLCLAAPQDRRPFDRVVVASGGKAYPALGSTGELFPVFQRLGHRVEPLRPALAPLLADMRGLAALEGVRLDAGLRLSAGERVLGETVGNIMFTKTGLSGPGAMDLSYLVSAQPGEALALALNLTPYTHDELFELLAAKRDTSWPLGVLLGAVLPAKVPAVLLTRAGIAEGARLRDVRPADLERLDRVLTALPLRVTGTRGLAQAQVSAGGVPVSEVVPNTMASTRVPGLHLAGEVLDVVGPCGGYNLQFAFTTGVIAGAGAANG
jgi:hypothetical protein